MINDTISDEAPLGGSAARATRLGQDGHVVFGPYRQLTHGVYQVEFTLALADGQVADDQVCAILDVSADYGFDPIVERQIRANELSTTPRVFTLLFVLRSIKIIEHRIYTNGAARLHVGSEPVMTRVSGVLDEWPSPELPHGDDAIALAQDTRRILRHLSPAALVDHRKVRLGNDGDGGYVCVDDFAGLDTAFSFGINDDISWDLDAADRGLHIFQFDHTVADPAPNDPRMTFAAKRVGDGGVSLSDLIRTHDKGLDKPNLILKMDIEQAEWEVIDATSVELLGRLAWIVCELHYLQGLASSQDRALMDRCLSKLGQIFTPVHVHANVWGGITSLSNVIFPNVIEATLVNRSVYDTVEGFEVYPTALDRSCDPGLPDYYLGVFRF